MIDENPVRVYCLKTAVNHCELSDSCRITVCVARTHTRTCTPYADMRGSRKGYFNKLDSPRSPWYRVRVLVYRDRVHARVYVCPCMRACVRMTTGRMCLSRANANTIVTPAAGTHSRRSIRARTHVYVHGTRSCVQNVETSP